MLADLAEIATADEPLPVEALTADEQAVLRSIGNEAARRDWLLGRTALKALVTGDTSTLLFPHPNLSITHSGGVAYAARPTKAVIGIGIDYEPWRAEVHPRMAAFFLRPAEQAAADSPQALVRLWTIKEALFKATPDNCDYVLLDIELTDANSAYGVAKSPTGNAMRYASADMGPGCLSVAVTEGRAANDGTDR